MTDPTPPPPLPGSPAAAPTPDPAAARSARRGGWAGLDPETRRPTLVVAALIAGLFFGSQILNEAIPASAAGGGRAGTPVTVAPDVTIVPMDGWSVRRLDGGPVRLEKGYVAVDLFPPGVEGHAVDLVEAYVDEFLRPHATQLSVGEPSVVAGDGRTAARLTYSGLFTGAEGTIEGEVTAVAGASAGVVADAWAPQGRLLPLLPEVHAMLQTLEVGA